MKTIFKSSVTRGGNIITPDIIEIDDYCVTYKKRNKFLIGVDSITIPISKISSVEIDTGLISASITIRSYGSGIIYAHNFTKSDAKEIKQKLDYLM